MLSQRDNDTDNVTHAVGKNLFSMPSGLVLNQEHARKMEAPSMLDQKPFPQQ